MSDEGAEHEQGQGQGQGRCGLGARTSILGGRSQVPSSPPLPARPPSAPKGSPLSLSSLFSPTKLKMGQETCDVGNRGQRLQVVFPSWPRICPSRDLSSRKTDRRGCPLQFGDWNWKLPMWPQTRDPGCTPCVRACVSVDISPCPWTGVFIPVSCCFSQCCGECLVNTALKPSARLPVAHLLG